jgi:hypothetical protein
MRYITSNDPVDHQRTSRPLVGQALKSRRVVRFGSPDVGPDVTCFQRGWQAAELGPELENLGVQPFIYLGSGGAASRGQPTILSGFVRLAQIKRTVQLRLDDVRKYKDFVRYI